MVDYTKWDQWAEESDDDGGGAGARRQERRTNKTPPPPTLTSEQQAYVDALANSQRPPANRTKPPPDFPSTYAEQAKKCDEAQTLKEEGNELYKQGDLLGAAKLYEQAVFKFAHWYADMFATDEERALVHAVKLPCHLNLAACSVRLNNHDHAVTHCTQVLKHDGRNVKALYRRGASSMVLGNLDDALADLRAAAELAPKDRDVRRELSECLRRRAEYRGEARSMSRRMVHGGASAG